MNAVSHNLVESIHLKIVEAASRYKKSEADLIDLIQQADQHKVFRHKGYSSLFEYVMKELKFSENVTSVFITVARKAYEVPELKAEIRTGNITLSNARRILPVLTSENKGEWLQRAQNLTQRQLEKEVVKIRPLEATRERVHYVTKDRVKLEMGFFETDMLTLRKIQDLICQKAQRAVSLEEAICIIAKDYLQRNDPVSKARRQIVRRSDLHASRPVIFTKDRVPISKIILHQVHLRDQRRCTHINPDGARCSQKRWLDIHHIVPVSEGGQNTLENLKTLCSTHHKHAHETMSSANITARS
jgi:5-methylcytosine-specific restriction endonuclease McrA